MCAQTSVQLCHTERKQTAQVSEIRHKCSFCATGIAVNTAVLLLLCEVW